MRVRALDGSAEPGATNVATTSFTQPSTLWVGRT
jgi:hypothetical protein